MEKHNKFQIGESVYLLHNNKIKQMFVYGVEFHIEGNLNKFYMYKLREFFPNTDSFAKSTQPENTLFTSKEELIKSL